MRLPIAFCSLLFAAACGGSSPATVTTAPAEPAAADDGHCPMDVPGTSVTVEDLPAGAAMVFVTTGDVAALKARIVPFADAHNAHHAAMGDLPTGDEPAGGGGEHHHHHAGMDMGGGDGGGHEGHGGGHEAGAMIGIHSRATVVDIDGGVRLELVTFPDQVGALRDELRAHAAHLSTTGCAMPAGH